MREKNKAELSVVSPDTSRQSLLNAVDIIPDSFVVWDKNLRFVDCNASFRALHADVAHLLVPGTKYEDYIRTRLKFGHHPNLVGDEEDWIAGRIASMKSGKSDYEVSVGDKWHRIVRKRLDNGDYVNYQKDITGEKKKELELAESEKFYHVLFEATPDSVYIHDGKKILLANPAFVKLLGAQRVEDVLGRGAIDHIPPETRERVLERIEGVLQSKAMVGVHGQEYVQINGARIEVETQGTLIPFAGQDAILVIAREITPYEKKEKELIAAYDNLEAVVEEKTRNLSVEIEERRISEKALKDSEVRFKDVAESASEWIWEMDADFRYTYMSARAYEIYGWDPNYPIGKTRFDLIDEEGWAIDRGAIDELQERFERHEEFRDVEFTVTTKDGGRFYTLISGKPIFDSSSKFSGYRGISRDVSEQTEIETELRKSEKISRVFLDATSDRVILLDTEGVILDANEALVARFGLPREKIIGENIFNILLEQNTVDIDLIDVRRNKFREVILEVKTVSLIEKTPTEWIETVFYPVVGESGKVVNVAVFSKDITQQKQIEETLRKAKKDADVANRSKTEFLANMSHELRSPLTAILGFTEAMKEEIFGPIENEKYADYIDSIYKSGSHLHQLINDILDVSSIEAGQIEISVEEVDIAEIVVASIRMLKPRADEAGVRITSEVQENLPNINGDGRRLKQILVNLLTNAYKFTPEKGNVTLKATLESEGVLISVSDTGIGMDEQGIEQALTKFGQVESDLMRRYEGTGLGLPLTVGLVEAHGGRLNIESKVGVGTVVSFVLPNERVIDI